MLLNETIKIQFQYDTNSDGRLDLRELKKFIKDNPNQKDFPKDFAKSIMLLHDEDGNGRLDFEEFFKLSKQHRWLFGDFCMKYCEAIIPSYEKHMRFYPPPLTMVIFSIIEISFFIYDVYYTSW